jgi:tetratricopeptide (TPR) repeat protein
LALSAPWWLGGFSLAGTTGLDFEVRCSQEQYHLGEPVVVRITATNRGEKPLAEAWADIGRVLSLELSSEERKIGLYQFSDLPAVAPCREKISLPAGHSVTFFLVLNFPGEPFHGVAGALGYADPEINTWRGELATGKYRLQVRLFLAGNHAQVTQNLWKDFVRENGIVDEAKATADQMKAFAEVRDKQLARLRDVTGMRFDFLAEAQFTVLANDEKSAALREALQAALVSCQAKPTGPDYREAIAKFGLLADKGKGTAWEAWAHYGLGRTYLLKKDAKEALASFTRAGELAGEEGYLPGSILLQQKKCYELLGEVEKAKEMDKTLREKYGMVGTFGEGVISLKPTRPGTK